MIRKITGLIPVKEKKKGILAVLSAFFSALSEFAGLALFIPLLYLLFDRNSIETNGLLHRVYQLSGISQPSVFILFICIFIFLLFFIKNFLTYRLTIFQNSYLVSLYRFFTIRLFAFYYNKGALFFKNQNSNNLAYHVNYISYAFVFNILSALIRIASEGMLFILLSVVILVISPKVYLLLLILFLPALFIYNRLIKSRLSEIGERENKSRKSQTRIVHEAFKGYAEVEVNQAFPLLLKNFVSELDTLTGCRMDSVKITGQWQRLLEMGAITGLLAILLFNTFFASQEGSFLVVFAILAVSLLRILPTIRNLLSYVNQIKSNMYVWDIVSELYGEDAEGQNFAGDTAGQTVAGNRGVQTDARNTAGRTDTGNTVGQTDTGDTVGQTDAGHTVGQTVAGESKLLFEDRIEIEDLTFGFHKDKEIIRNLNITIRKGERVAIKGLSGSGKTTLFHLLLGLYPPGNGRILIDGIELTPVNRNAWHRMVGYVSQDVFILDGSLALNVALGVEAGEIDYQRVEAVLQQAGLTSFLAKLPDGAESKLGDGGSKVSGGERQRIGIARALYSKSSVLLFDEATSSVDAKTEQEINEAIVRLFETQRDLTILVIAHRESTLMFCDRAVEMGNSMN